MIYGNFAVGLHRLQVIGVNENPARMVRKVGGTVLRPGLWNDDTRAG